MLCVEKVEVKVKVEEIFSYWLLAVGFLKYVGYFPIPTGLYVYSNIILYDMRPPEGSYLIAVAYAINI
jgi:hypothetical protein